MRTFSVLQKRIIFTLASVILYRIASFIPIPVIDINKISLFLKTAKLGVFSLFNTFSGGSVARGSIFALGIMPYISASIIVQMIILTNPELKKLRKEDGEMFNKKVSSYSRYMTIIVAILQGFGIYSLLDHSGMILSSEFYSILECKVLGISSFVVGTFILMWLADRISIKGIGNGTSLIIFTGIVAESPREIINLFNLAKNGNISSLDLLIIIGVFVSILTLVIFFERSNRILQIQYPTQIKQALDRSKQSVPNFMPIKINPAGVMPPILASAVILIPNTIVSLISSKNSTIVRLISEHFTHGTLFFILINSILIIIFSFLYNSMVFDPNEIANQLKKSNVFLPGIRPGEATVSLLQTIINRLSFIGAIYLCIVCGSQELLIMHYGSAMFISGTSILIILNIINDTGAAIQSYIMPAKYERTIKRYR